MAPAPDHLALPTRRAGHLLFGDQETLLLAGVTSACGEQNKRGEQLEPWNQAPRRGGCVHAAQTQYDWKMASPVTRYQPADHICRGATQGLSHFRPFDDPYSDQETFSPARNCLVLP
jgi:hypothetical protein